MYNTTLKLDYISYYKINQSKEFDKIFYYLYIFKKYNGLIFNYLALPKKRKYFTLVKSPKCYKVGKFLINYRFFKFFLKLNFKCKLVNFDNLINYFNYIKKKYNIYQTIFAKNNKISLKINIQYKLKILYDSRFNNFLYYL